MSVKENVEYIKEELSSQEKMLQSFIRFEGFYRRNKIVVITGVAVVILAVAGYFGYSYHKESKIEAASAAYTKALNGDESQLDTLKANNKKLYNLYMFQKGVKSGDAGVLEGLSFKSDTLEQLRLYEIAAIKGTKESLQNYNRQLLNEFALFAQAHKLLKEGALGEAELKLSMIRADSPLSEYATMLKHYKGIEE